MDKTSDVINAKSSESFVSNDFVEDVDLLGDIMEIVHQRRLRLLGHVIKMRPTVPVTSTFLVLEKSGRKSFSF